MRKEIKIKCLVYGQYYVIYKPKTYILEHYDLYKRKGGTLNLLGYVREQKMLFERDYKAKIDRQKYKEKLTKKLFELRDDFNYMSDKDIDIVTRKVVSEILNNK